MFLSNTHEALLGEGCGEQTFIFIMEPLVYLHTYSDTYAGNCASLQNGLFLNLFVVYYFEIGSPHVVLAVLELST